MTSLEDIFIPFTGDRLVEWFNDLTELWHDTTPIKPNDISSPKGLTQWVHYKNYIVWHLEEKVRKEGVNDQEVLKCEKRIDQHNLKRLEAMEQIDIWIENVLESAGIEPDNDAELNSETPGSIVDRISSISLKIFHMKEHLANDNLENKQAKILQLRLAVLKEQITDLAQSMDKLLLDLRQSRKKHKVYRQFKLYNDPSFHSDNYILNI